MGYVQKEYKFFVFFLKGTKYYFQPTSNRGKLIVNSCGKVAKTKIRSSAIL